MTPGTNGESLADLLGGRRGAWEASLPPVAFVVGWALSGQSVGLGVAVAAATAVTIAGWALRQGRRPRAVWIALLGVAVCALLVLRTGRAEDFFALQIATNAASALAWTVSIVVRWPLLGLVVGSVLGQRATWRRDPALLRGYQRASWVWVLQYAVRLAVLVPLWLAGQVVALGVARAVLTWPLVATCLAVSWWVLRSSLPPGHPGLRHPQSEATPAGR